MTPAVAGQEEWVKQDKDASQIRVLHPSWAVGQPFPHSPASWWFLVLTLIALRRMFCIFFTQTLLYSKSECSLRVFAVGKRESLVIPHEGVIRGVQTDRNGGR
jgi:hypothetical protein